jgi:hypothetical protein
VALQEAALGPDPDARLALRAVAAPPRPRASGGARASASWAAGPTPGDQVMAALASLADAGGSTAAAVCAWTASHFGAAASPPPDLRAAMARMASEGRLDRMRGDAFRINAMVRRLAAAPPPLGARRRASPPPARPAADDPAAVRDRALEAAAAVREAEEATARAARLLAYARGARADADAEAEAAAAAGSAPAPAPVWSTGSVMMPPPPPAGGGRLPPPAPLATG